jgi:hypothetical protein
MLFCTLGAMQVPLPYAPTAAHALQDCVAQHVVSSAAAQQPPQHTVMHMVSVPGCIQLLMSVVQWRQGQQPPALPAAAAGAAGAAPQQQQQQQVSSPQALAGMFGLADMTPAPAAHTQEEATAEQMHVPQQLYSHSNASSSAVASTVIACPAAAAAAAGPGPAPAWMVQAICRGVEQFMRMQAGEAVTPATINPTATASTTGIITTPLPRDASAAGAARADTSSSSSVLQEPCSGEDPSCVQQRLLGAPGPAVAALQLTPAAWPAPPALIDINGQRYQLQPDLFDAAAPWSLQQLEQQGCDDDAGAVSQGRDDVTGVRSLTAAGREGTRVVQVALLLQQAVQPAGPAAAAAGLLLGYLSMQCCQHCQP